MLLYVEMYTVTNVPVASSLLKQIIILTRVDNPASTMHICETLIESRSKLVTLKGNITEFNQWVRKPTGQLHAREQEAVDLLYYLWKAHKAAPDEEFVTYIKDLKSQCDDRRATFTAEDLMVHAENKYKACLLDKENVWGKPTEEQEKIVAMSAEINSLKKERRGTSSKMNKQKQAVKKQAQRKQHPRNQRIRRKRPMTSGLGKTRPQKNRTPKKMMLLSKPLKQKNTFGVKTTTMELECGLSITQTNVRVGPDPTRQRLMLILLHSTQ